MTRVQEARDYPKEPMAQKNPLNLMFSRGLAHPK